MSILVPQQVPGRAVHMELEGGDLSQISKGKPLVPRDFFLGGHK